LTSIVSIPRERLRHSHSSLLTLDSNGLHHSPPPAPGRLHRALTGRLLLPQRAGRLPDAHAQALQCRADQRTHRNGPGQAVRRRQAIQRRADQRSAGHEPEQAQLRGSSIIDDLRSLISDL
ncbi:hypothetical protein PENTCL1PPCAC_9918, partial [Pristionchus entomophagus]